jgi:hypothetical protein
MQAFFPNKIKIASLSYRERPKKVPYGRQHLVGNYKTRVSCWLLPPVSNVREKIKSTSIKKMKWLHWSHVKKCTTFQFCPCHVLVIINDGVGLSNNCSLEWWSNRWTSHGEFLIFFHTTPAYRNKKISHWNVLKLKRGTFG